MFYKLNDWPTKLGDVADVFVGIQTSADSVFIMDLVEEDENGLHLKSKELDSIWQLEKDLFYPIVSGTDTNRYSELPNRQYVLFPYEISNGKAELISFEEIKTRFPKTAEYLLTNKEKLASRERGRMKGSSWYGYVYLKNMARQFIAKLCVPRLVSSLYSAYDEEGSHILDNVDVGGIVFKPKYEAFELEYLLALLNSKLLKWFFPFVSAPFRGGWWSANRQFLSKIPINLTRNQSTREQLVALSKQMQKLHRQLAAAHTAHEKTVTQRQIDATDRQIDQLVYQLYDLTPEEIAIVEGQA